MLSIREKLNTLCQTAISQHFGDAIAASCHPKVRRASRPQYGDYQVDCAMQLAKQLGDQPRHIAKKLQETIQEASWIARVEVAGPGFINITLESTYLEQCLSELLQDPRVGIERTSDSKPIVVDYSSPNIAKEMHIGHLRSTVIGDAIVRILEYVGHHVIRQNHVGDWGTQFGMLIEHILSQHKSLDASLSISELNQWYQEAKQRFDQEPDFAEAARRRVVALQAGDLETLTIWKNLVKQSLEYFQTLYEQLGISLQISDSRGESFYNPMLPKLIRDLQQKDIIEESQGAQVIPLEGFTDQEGAPLAMLIQKSDGAYLYATTDLAAAQFRLQTLGADRLIYVIDARQKQHLAMLFAATRKAGWGSEDTQLEHVPFGTVLNQDKKPFKTRSGGTVSLASVLEEAKKRAYQIVIDKNPELPKQTQQNIAATIAVGALKYADLSNDKIKDYVFNLDHMLSFEGNTAPYLQNAYVRIQAIFRKADSDLNAFSKSLPDQKIILDTPEERQLALKLITFAPLIERIAQNLALHHLCQYLYDLASLFHRFYEACPILSVDDKALSTSRLLLCSITKRTLKIGLNLLGIDVLDRM